MIRVLVVGLDDDSQRVDVSVKRLSADPAPVVVSHLRVGQTVFGTVLGRRNDSWDVNIEPWAIIGSAPTTQFEGLEPVSRARVEAVIHSVNPRTGVVQLRQVVPRRDPTGR